MAKLPTMSFKVGGEKALADLNWVFITGDGKKNDMNPSNPKWEYTATAYLKEADAEPYIKQLDDFWEENKGKGWKRKSPGYKYVLDDDEEKTGIVSFVFKTNTTWTDRKDRVHDTLVKVLNPAGENITTRFSDKKIGEGSTGVVHGVAGIYDNGIAARGVTLYLNAVQLVKLVEYSDSIDSEDLSSQAEDPSLGVNIPSGDSQTEEELVDI